MTTGPPRPFTRAILDAVVPPTARWFVSAMRRMEEATTDPHTRWELLRRRLEQLGHADDTEPAP